MYPEQGNNTQTNMYQNQDGQKQTYQNAAYRQSTYGENMYGSNAHGFHPYGQQQSQMNGTGRPKKKRVGRLFAIVGSGLLFGFCAGFVILLMINLMPEKSESNLQKNPGGKIEQVEQVNEEFFSEDGEREEPSGEAYTQDGGIDATQTAESKEAAEEIAIVTDVTKVVDTVMPSVVSIFGTYDVTQNFFGYSFSQQEQGSGSGIIVGQNDDELLIVTNNHVVADSTSLSVQFIDDTTCDALVKGTSADEDLAVISVQLTDIDEKTKEAIKIATLGDSEHLKVGEPAIAIGNALGYGQSVTTGVISAVNREQEQDEYGRKTYVIQTDAAINPGNSGGALLNVYGEVVGINSSKIASSAVEGMGYAIPISTAKPIIEELMNKKTRIPVSENKKGFLGISGINVTETVHEAYGLPMGVYLAQVFAQTPAEKYGLKKGDIIVSFDGEEVQTMEQLSLLLDCSEAGSSVELGVMSATYNAITGEDEYVAQTITVVLGERE